MPRKTPSRGGRRGSERGPRRPHERNFDRGFAGFRRLPRGCRLCRDKVRDIDYKNVELLQRYVSERGKITPSRISGNCASHQRLLSKAIRRARTMALLPFVGE